MPRKRTPKPLAPRHLLEELLLRQEKLRAEQLAYLEFTSGKIKHNPPKQTTYVPCTDRDDLFRRAQVVPL